MKPERHSSFDIDRDLERLSPTAAERKAVGGAEEQIHGFQIESLAESLHHALIRERGVFGWLASRPTRTRGCLVAITAGTGVALQLVAARRSDFPSYPKTAFAAAFATYAGILALSSEHLLRPLHRPLPSPRLTLTALALGAVVPLGWSFEASLTGHLVPAGVGVEWIRQAAACFVYGSIFAAPLLFLIYGVDRLRHAPLRRALLTANAGGLTANLVLYTHCAITSPGHLLAGHASVSVALMVAYAVAYTVRGGRARNASAATRPDA